MQRSLTSLLVGALLFVSAAQAAEPEWITESNRHTQVLLEVNARYPPESAADLGLEQYDRQIFDLKPKFDERLEADLATAIAQLEAARASVKDDRAKQDLDILIKAAQRQATTSALNRRLMIPYFDVGKQIFGSFQDMLDARVDKKRYPAALVRLKRYAGTERGYEPLPKLARARIEERMNDGSLTWPWVVEVQQNLDNAPRYIDGMRDLLQEKRTQGMAEGFRRADPRAESSQRLGAHHRAAACAQDEPAATGDLRRQPQGVTESKPIRATSCSARCSPTCRHGTRWTRSRASTPRRKVSNLPTTAMSFAS